MEIWEPIYTSISVSVKLVNKLYVQVEKYGENQKVATRIVRQVWRLEKRLGEYSKGYRITSLHEKVAKRLLKEIICMNSRITKLTEKLEKKIAAFMRACKISQELEKIEGSIEFLKTRIFIFGLALSNRIEQANQTKISEEIYSVVSEVRGSLKHFIEVYNPSSTSNGATGAIASQGGREKEQEKAIANIPALELEVMSSKLSEQHKREIRNALRSAKSSWRHPVESFSIDKDVNGRDIVLRSRGTKIVYKGHLEVRTSEEEDDCTIVPVAILEYNIGPAGLPARKGSIWREILLSWKISHPCIVNTHGAFWPKESEKGLPPKIFSELMSCNLTDDKGTKALQNPETRLQVAVDIAEGLAYLHSRKIVHRNLKPENVLLRIDEDVLVDRAKLCDFGASYEFKTTFLTKSIAPNELTLHAPPEEILGEEITEPFAFDLWSYGVILCWLDGDERRKPVGTLLAISELARSGELLQKSKEWVASIGNEVLRKCAEECIREKPQNRASISNILEILQSAKRYADAVKFHTESDFGKAVGILEEIVPSGNEKAIFLLARCYSEGQGVEKDGVRALNLYQMAADKGHVNALFSLAQLYEEGRDVMQDEKHAAELYQKAAEKEHPGAQFHLAQLYGRGVNKDEKHAARWYARAADQGHPQAQYYLGKMYLRGQGVKKDKRLAFQLFESSAGQECAKSQYALGRLYEEGEGVTQSSRRAVELYDLAAQQGHEQAGYRLGLMLRFGIGVAEDSARAAQLRERATLQSDEDAFRRNGGL